jgi:hypothetical protein
LSGKTFHVPHRVRCIDHSTSQSCLFSTFSM